MGKSGIDRSIMEIYRLSAEERRREYEAVDIAKIVIDGDTYTNYGAYQFIWEKTYNESPTRSLGGKMDDLNSHTTFLVGHFIINFSLMSIDDYRSIMKKHYSKNEFVVECYDVINDKKVKLKMYFATEEMAKLHTIAKMKQKSNGEWEEWVELVGVEGYTVEMIGTNNELDLVNVTYHLNPPIEGMVDEQVGEPNVYKGEQVVIGGGAGFQEREDILSRGWKFKTWNISPQGGEQGNYIDGSLYTINQDLVLYAQWEKTDEVKLNFSYGIFEPTIGDDFLPILSKTVSFGKNVGELPEFDPRPPVEYGVGSDGNPFLYYPYTVIGWYKNARGTGAEIKSNTLYWTELPSTAYLVYNTASYPLYYYVDGEKHSQTSLKYGDTLQTPELFKNGYNFDGWYTSENFEQGTKASGTMPPYALYLYARFIEE